MSEVQQEALVNNVPKVKYMSGIAQCGRCNRSVKIRKTILREDKDDPGIFEEAHFKCLCQGPEGFVCTVYWD